MSYRPGDEDSIEWCLAETERKLFENELDGDTQFTRMACADTLSEMTPAQLEHFELLLALGCLIDYRWAVMARQHLQAWKKARHALQ